MMNKDQVITNWLNENMRTVTLVVYASSNYLLAEAIREETGESVTPADLHIFLLDYGCVCERRYKTCYAYNLKYKITVTGEDIVDISNFTELPTRHKPMIFFAQVGHDGPFYINIATNVLGRVADLDKYNPNNITLRGIMTGAFTELHSLRGSLEPWLLKGGWYEPSPELMKFIYQSGKVENDWTPDN